MTLRMLTGRSLRFHWRGHLGVLLGAAVGSAALIGALVVGDSVRLSLRELALQRLGWVVAAMAPPDRFFTQQLAWKLSPPGGPHVAAVLKLPGTAARQDGGARANQVNVLGIAPDFWEASGSTPGTNLLQGDVIPKGSAILNEALAAQLHAGPGDDIVLRIHKPSALSRDVPIAPQSDASLALRLKVHAIAPASRMGNFSLQSEQAPPLNAFLNVTELGIAAGVDGKANVLLVGEFWTWATAQDYGSPLRRLWFQVRSLVPWGKPREELALSAPSDTAAIFTARTAEMVSLADCSIQVRIVENQQSAEILTDRIFLSPAVVDPILIWTRNDPESLRQRKLRSRLVVDPETGLPVVDPAPNSRVIVDPATGLPGAHLDFTNARPLLTYLVNQLRSGEHFAPYSMVTAAGPPWTPAGLRDDEIIVNQWLADDLQIKSGDALDLTYFLVESGAHLVERTNRFRVRGVVPISGVYGDRTLMPEYPGLAKAESTHEWDAGFPLIHKIGDQDEDYWKKYRGTPKAFVTLAAGQAMWGNRFGNLTAIRFPVPKNEDAMSFRDAVEQSLLLNINPSSLGLRFEPVRAQALAAANQSQDFGGLFIGFSFFLILAALILMALLFQFGLEQRTNEIGTLLALGFTPRRVRNFLLGEGIAIAFVGGVMGMFGGVGYANAMLYGLATLWRDAVGTSALRFHVTPMTLAIGLLSSVLVCAATIWIVLRKQARRPARELLAEGAELNVERSTLHAPRSTLTHWIAIGSSVAALAMIGWAVFGGDGVSPGLFFGAGALLLVGLLAATAWLLATLDRSEASRRLSISAMGLRGCTRRRTRSLASVALLACGSFLVVAVGANRLDSGRDATRRSSGTGGFALFGEATLPVVRDLNTKTGREFYGLDENVMKGVSVVSFRVRDGDDASCLNLNRAQTPRLLGVKPELLAERKAFAFANVLKGRPAEKPWELLRSAGLRPGTATNDTRRVGDRRSEEDAIPAIGDAASIQWALGKKLGDTIEYTDEHGQKFKVRLVAGVANSILQGNLIIDEAEFVKRFPSESGHRMFLVDAPSNTGADAEKVSAAMSRALQDVGLELTPTSQRLAAFNAVQNTYLNTFQVLGGLGLLLGSVGLGVVVLRNVLERRSELGLLQAVGFRRRSLQWLVLSEHGGLLGLGLAVGISAAVAAVLPALLAPGAEMHYVALAITLAGVLLSGLLWTLLATKFALRGELLKALRNE